MQNYTIGYIYLGIYAFPRECMDIFTRQYMRFQEMVWIYLPGDICVSTRWYGYIYFGIYAFPRDGMDKFTKQYARFHEMI